MKRMLRPFYLLVGVLLTASFVNAQEKTIKQVPAKPTVSVDGKSLFHEYCAVCHGENGKGTGPAASALKQAPTDLTQIAHNNGGKFPDDRILRIVKGEEAVSAHGTQDMPMWGKIFSNMGNLTTAQARTFALLQFIEGLQAK
jgi:mono/diheme cytochrome c family protein